MGQLTDLWRRVLVALASGRDALAYRWDRLLDLGWCAREALLERLRGTPLGRPGTASLAAALLAAAVVVPLAVTAALDGDRDVALAPERSQERTGRAPADRGPEPGGVPPQTSVQALLVPPAGASPAADQPVGSTGRRTAAAETTDALVLAFTDAVATRPRTTSRGGGVARPVSTVTADAPAASSEPLPDEEPSFAPDDGVAGPADEPTVEFAPDETPATSGEQPPQDPATAEPQPEPAPEPEPAPPPEPEPASQPEPTVEEETAEPSRPPKPEKTAAQQPAG